MPFFKACAFLLSVTLLLLGVFAIVVSFFAFPLFRDGKGVPTRAESSGIMHVKEPLEFNYSLLNGTKRVDNLEVKNVNKINYTDRGEFVITNKGFYAIDAHIDIDIFNATFPGKYIADYIILALSINGKSANKTGERYLRVRHYLADSVIDFSSTASFHDFVRAEVGDTIGLVVKYANEYRFQNWTVIPSNPTTYSGNLTIGIVDGEFLIYSISLT